MQKLLTSLANQLLQYIKELMYHVMWNLSQERNGNSTFEKQSV